MSIDFFRPKDRFGLAIRACLDRRASVKDLVESCGIPHTEVGYLEMDGKEVDFSHIPRSPGRLAVRGIPAPFDVERPPFFQDARPAAGFSGGGPMWRI